MAISLSKQYNVKTNANDKYEKAWTQDIINNNEKIGKISFNSYSDINALGFGSFEIFKEYRNNGFGSKVVKNIIDGNKDKYDMIYCYVDKDNEPAIHLYKKFGKVTDIKDKSGKLMVVFHEKKKSLKEDKDLSGLLLESNNSLLSNVKTVCKKISDYVAKYDKENSEKIEKTGQYVGNQNCAFSSLAFEMQMRGNSNFLPRPVFSPTDKIFDNKVVYFIDNPDIIKFTNIENIKKEVISAGNKARFHAHIKNITGAGGHEFIIMNIDGGVFVIDPQSNLIADIDSKKAGEYLSKNEINYNKSFLYRLDNKEINKNIIELNKIKYLKHFSDEDYDLIEGNELLDEEVLTEVWPHAGESKEEFIKRFLSETKKEYPDIKQRYAVANSYWERRKTHLNENVILLQDIDKTNKIYDVIDNVKDIVYGFIDKNDGSIHDDREWIHHCDNLQDYYETNFDPEITLKNKLGICLDQSLAIKYLINKLHPTFNCNIYALRKGRFGHAVPCYCDDNKNWYYLENAWDKERGLHGPFNTEDELKQYLNDIYYKNHCNDNDLPVTVEYYERGLTESCIYEYYDTIMLNEGFDTTDMYYVYQEYLTEGRRLKYFDYIHTHTNNVKKGYRWLKKNCPDLFESIPEKAKISATIMRHDLSKYNPKEFGPYSKHFFGNEEEKNNREMFDKAWNHHQKINKHHWQYWVLVDASGKNKVLDMPYENIIEMVCDWWSFSWKSGDLKAIFSWYEKNKNNMILSPKTRATVEKILGRLKMELIKKENNKNLEESINEFIDLDEPFYL